MPQTKEGACRACGCTEERACFADQGCPTSEGCEWVEPGLCSECLRRAKVVVRLFPYRLFKPKTLEELKRASP